MGCPALAFAELVAAAGFLLTEFLTFHTTGIAGQQTSGLERRAPLRVQADQRAGNPQLGCFGLAFLATTGCIDLDVELSGTINRQVRVEEAKQSI